MAFKPISKRNNCIFRPWDLCENSDKEINIESFEIEHQVCVPSSSNHIPCPLQTLPIAENKSVSTNRWQFSDFKSKIDYASLPNSDYKYSLSNDLESSSSSSLSNSSMSIVNSNITNVNLFNSSNSESMNQHLQYQYLNYFKPLSSLQDPSSFMFYKPNNNLINLPNIFPVNQDIFSVTSSVLNRFSKIHSKKQRPKRFQCPHCQVCFSNNGQLKGHIRIHTGK